jgi:hypothetical protein
MWLKSLSVFIGMARISWFQAHQNRILLKYFFEKNSKIVVKIKSELFQIIDFVVRSSAIHLVIMGALDLNHLNPKRYCNSSTLFDRLDRRPACWKRKQLLMVKPLFILIYIKGFCPRPSRGSLVTTNAWAPMVQDFVGYWADPPMKMALRMVFAPLQVFQCWYWTRSCPLVSFLCMTLWWHHLP